MGRNQNGQHGVGARASALQHLLRLLLSSALGLLLAAGLVGLGSRPAQASLTNNSYDGNIYALYAGNGSLVPPRSSLAQALADHRTTVVVYYLDDDAATGSSRDRADLRAGAPRFANRVRAARVHR